MTPSHPSGEDAGRPAGKEAEYREMIHEMLSLSLRERDVLNKVITWSIALPREWAVFHSMQDFALLCGIQRSHIWVVIKGLKRKGLLEIADKRPLRMRFLKDGILVDPPVRVDSGKLAEVLARTRALIGVRDRCEPNGQELLALKTPEETFSDEQRGHTMARAGESLREYRRRMSALPDNGTAPIRTTVVRMEPNEAADCPVNRTVEEQPSGKPDGRTEPIRTADVRIGQNAGPDRPVNRTVEEQPSGKPDGRTELGARENDATYIRRERAHHGHVHVPTSYPLHEHDHGHAGGRQGDHAPDPAPPPPEPAAGSLREKKLTDARLEEMLSEDARHALRRLESLPGTPWEDYHHAWLLWLNEAHRDFALEAIGDILRNHREGKTPKKTWGHWARSLFQGYVRDADSRTKTTSKPE